MDDTTIEQEIQAKGANVAPRITPADIEANIIGEVYINPHMATLDSLRFQFLTDDHSDPEVRGKLRTIHERMGVMSTEAVRNEVDEIMAIPGESTEPLRLLTFCILILKNGFTVTGESACASPENFNAEIGFKIARDNAIAKIWPLMGYELRSKLAAEQAKPQTYQDRVRAEAAELDERIKKLEAFMRTELFQDLPAEERASMRAQRDAMMDYSNCLYERIKRFEA